MGAEATQLMQEGGLETLTLRRLAVRSRADLPSSG